MKKLGLILAVVAMAALLAFPALAGEKVKITGEFDYSAITPFDAAKAGDAFGNFYLDTTLPVDDYNEILFEIGGAKTGTSDQGTSPTIGYFQLTTDVGAAFDLPVGLKTKAGITSVWSRKFEVSGHAKERPVRPFIDPVGLVGVIDVQEKATINVGVGFGQGIGLNDIGVLVSVPAIGPASLEAYYLANNNDDFKGWVGANVKATGLLNEMLSVAGMFAFNMQDTFVDTTPAIIEYAEWAFGLGVSVKYNIVTAGVSFNGNDVDPFNQLAVDVDAKFTDMVGATAAFGLSFAEGTDAFQGADISAYVTPGASTWRVGYIITENAYAYGSNAAVMDGGLYFSAGIDF